MIIEKLEVGPIAANCYIVGDKDTKEGMIIDPGAEGRRILKKVKDLELKVKIIALTHIHFDHIGAVKQVKEATGAEVAVHGDDAKILTEQFNVAGIPNIPVPTPDKLLKGGDSITIGKLRFLVIHTPGHTPGGVCLFGEGTVFTGDTLFNFGIGRTDFPGGNYNQLMTSIHTKLMILPNDTKVYPGHGLETTIGIERLHNPFLQG